MATVIIQKRKRDKYTSYIIYYKDPFSGERKYYKSLRRRKDAQQEANDLRSLLDSGKIPDPKKNIIRPMTFKEVGKGLQSDWVLQLDKEELSGVTVDGYEVLLGVLNRDFGRRLLCEISKKDIETYRAQVVKDLSKVSSNRRLFILKQVFKKGIELNCVAADPVKDLQYLNEKTHQRTRFVLPPILDDLILASQKTRAKFYMPSLIFLGSEHGAAKQEALSLHWKDIDFDFGTHGIIRFFRTKNKKERTEFLMPRTREALLQWKAHVEWMRRRKRIDVLDTSLVFCHLNGTPLLRFDKAWRRICELVGLEDFHYHDLRHTFCSNLLLSGSDLKDVKEMIGHSDIAMTDRYSHLPSQHKAFRQSQLAEHYEGGNGVGNT
ncbi:hypothetical protein D1BOALGB6SA_8786 [Olavius sp. associated proteobacterium Delta 1]|nr:hypothetical protein D1BOALGB6SA_8786 [Olavius sp. associated proteobacterium Delta 1]CAD7840161.1 MAG: hypothetical protein [Olavius algarvensis spirochete endosymbiont]